MAVRTSFANALFYTIFSEAILYGIYVALFAIAMSLLLTKRRTTVNIWLTVVTLFMFLISSAHMAMTIQYADTAYLDEGTAREGNTVPHHEGNAIVYAPAVLEIINFCAADAIVLWRAWVLWGKTWRSLVIPLFLWLASVAEGIGSMYTLAALASSAPLATSATTWGIVFNANICFSNFWAVGMIGYRYYLYYKEVITVLGRRRSSYRTLLILIIESGLLYCFSLLLLFMLCVFADQSIYLIVLYHLLAQLTAIYPTMIIVIVCLRLTQQDDIERFYSSIRCVSTSAATSDPRTTQEPAPATKVSIAYSPGLGETKGAEGADATTAESTELDGIHSVRGKYDSPV